MGPKVRGRSVAPPGEDRNRCAGTSRGTPPKVEEDVKSISAAADGDHADNTYRARGSSEPRTPHRQQQTPHQEQRFGKRGSGQAFALGLFQILKTEDPKVIGWSPSGKAFRIGDSEKFCKDIMPRFFKQNKYSSFQRQLNLYGFRKLVRGNEAGGYMHPLFERGKPEQLSQVRRGYFPEIPPEFAQDVHGHGLNDNSNNNNNSKSDGIPGSCNGRGRKSEPQLDMIAGGLGPRSSSVGRPERAGMDPAVEFATYVVTNAAVPRGGNCLPRGSGGEDIGKNSYGRHVTGAMDTEWDCPQGSLPSLEAVTRNLRNFNGGTGGGGGQGGGAAEMLPPTLGRLVPTKSGLSRESSPMKPNGTGHGNGHVDGTRTHALPLSLSSNVRQPNAPPSQPERYHPPPYGRSQDDLNLTPRSHFPCDPIMGMPGGGPPSFGTEWSPNDFLHDSSFHGQLSRGGGQGHGHGHEFFVSNGGNNDDNKHHLNRPSHHSPRALLQQTHSRDDLDAIRPRKTRRCTEPPSFTAAFMGDSIFQQQQQQQQQQLPFAVTDSLRRRGGAGGVQGYPNPRPSSSIYGGTDEPPAPPRRLVSRHSTPSRPDRRGSSKKEQQVRGEERVAQEPPPRMSLMDPDDADMDTDGGAGMAGSHGYCKTRTREFYPAVSPVTVAPALGFTAGRVHQRHPPSEGGRKGWRPAGDVTPERVSSILKDDSPSSTKPGGGCVGGAVGGGAGAGLGLTKHAMSRMEQVKANQPGGQVPALDKNFSKLDISEGSQQHQIKQRQHQQAPQMRHQKHQHQQHAGVNGTRDLDAELRQAKAKATAQQQQQQQNRRHPSDAGASGVANQKLQGSGSGGSGRKLTAADAVELLGRRSSVEEVIELLSAPTSGSDGGFEDETSKIQACDPAQFDSWRNSLTKVLGHLGFDFQDEHGVPLTEGKRSPDGGSSTRGTSQYLSWGGTSAMSFEEQPEEFHESLRQIPMRWRSSLSSIMTSMASNGALEDNAGTHSGGEGGMDVAGEGRSGKRLEQQASLEMLQSVMRETLESMSSGQDHDSTDGGEEEAKAAAAAALAMGSMCRDKANGVGSCGSGGGDDLNANGSGRSGRAYNVSPAVPGGDVSVGVPGYYAQKGRGGGGYNHEHTTF